MGSVEGVLKAPTCCEESGTGCPVQHRSRGCLVQDV